MEKLRDLPWLRIFAEGVAIVVSILLAFSIEAWWNNKQHQTDERVVLLALLDDVKRMQGILIGAKTLSDVIFESATELLQAKSDPDRELSAPEIDTLLGNLLWFHTASYWESAPINSLMMGGDISLISNIVLAQELAALQVLMDRLQSNYQFEAEFYYEQWTPFLNRYSDLVQVYLTIDQEHGTQTPYEFPKIALSTTRDHSELLSMTEFRGLLIQMIDSQINSRVFAYPQLEEKLTEVIALLDAELRK